MLLLRFSVLTIFILKSLVQSKVTDLFLRRTQKCLIHHVQIRELTHIDFLLLQRRNLSRHYIVILSSAF